LQVACAGALRRTLCGAFAEYCGAGRGDDEEAKAAGAVTSFDLNFREKLWNIQGGAERAVETIGRIVENVDVLVGTRRICKRDWAFRT